MKFLTFFCGLIMAATCPAAGPKSLAEAWQYVATPNKSERWVVVSAKDKDGFFQCENLDDIVRGVIPVWSRIKPGVDRSSPRNGRETPYAEVSGSELIEHMSSEKIKKAQDVLKRFGIETGMIYSQVVDSKDTLIGTQCDIRFVLDLSYKNFSELAQQYLLEVYGVKKDAGYLFETDSS